jgi:hypothetical protein
LYSGDVEWYILVAVENLKTLDERESVAPGASTAKRAEPT